MPDLAAGLRGLRPLMDRLQVGRLPHCSLTGSASTASMAIGPAGPQNLPVHDLDLAAIDSFVDRLVTHMPPVAARPAAPQPAADLRRRPSSGELVRHDLSKYRVVVEPARLRPATAHVRLVVGVSPLTWCRSRLPSLG
jgi:hypothetical protein